jgi:hypothetical protein
MLYIWKNRLLHLGPKIGGVIFDVEIATNNPEVRCDNMPHPM